MYVSMVQLAYAALAAAVVAHGIRENDVEFLRSAWCEELKVMAQLCIEHGSKHDGSGRPRSDVITLEGHRGS